MALSPWFRSPLTDLTATLVSHQQYDKCGKFEMNMIDCLEAYGVERGQIKCKDIIEDFQECVGMTKQLLRFHAMRNERHKQWFKGERSDEEHYAPPPKIDAY